MPVVYSTDRGRICPGCGNPVAACACRKRAEKVPSGPVRVALERKGRGGKAVSVVTGLPLDGEGLRDLCGELKRRCGAGGTVKDGAIEIQGDHRDALVSELVRRGHAARKSGG